VDIERRDRVSVFDLFDRVELIPLETTDGSLIREVSKLMVYGDKYFVLDYPQSRVFVFDRDGKFLFGINGKGQGPNEYPSICDMVINADRQELELLSPVDRSLHRYTLGGIFIQRVLLPEIVSAYTCFKHVAPDVIVFLTFDEENIIKFYSISRNEIINETFPEKDNFFNHIRTDVFPYGNYLIRHSENTVYHIRWDGKNGSVEEGYAWDFGPLNNGNKTAWDAAPAFGNQKEVLEYMLEKVLTSEVVNYIMALRGGNRRYRYAQLTRKMKLVNIFCDMETRQTVVFDKTVEGASLNSIYWTDEYMVGIPRIPLPQEPFDMIPDAILSEKDRIRKQRLAEDDNPYLVKYYFKSK
jgi:hypothetical protein